MELTSAEQNLTGLARAKRMMPSRSSLATLPMSNELFVRNASQIPCAVRPISEIQYFSIATSCICGFFFIITKTQFPPKRTLVCQCRCLFICTKLPTSFKCCTMARAHLRFFNDSKFCPTWDVLQPSNTREPGCPMRLLKR